MQILEELTVTPKEAIKVELEIAVLSEATQVIVENHYLKRRRTMAQIAYWINYQQARVGVLLFALPRMSVRTDKFNNWSPMEIIELARLWIDPSIQERKVMDSNFRVHSLPIASMAIGSALKRISDDWSSKYPHLPVIKGCVAWSDDVFHQGTIYRASNFKLVGKSGGSLHGQRQRTNGGRDKMHNDYKNPKSAFLYEFRCIEKV